MKYLLLSILIFISSNVNGQFHNFDLEDNSTVEEAKVEEVIPQDLSRREFIKLTHTPDELDNSGYEQVKGNTTGVCYLKIKSVVSEKEPSADVTLKQICCEGYKKNVHNPNLCDPICLEECINSICVEPNRCKCYPDYVANNKGECVSTCPIGCENGECNGNKCICKQGYRLDGRTLQCVISPY